MSQTAIPTVLMRAGTSKGLFFDKQDLPAEDVLRDQVLLRAMGSPDPRQIDGAGAGHPLTSKVAIVSRSQRDDADVDYLFLQVSVEKAEVSASQNCGNLLAGVGAWAIERGLVKADAGHTDVRIHMENTGRIARARIETPERQVRYSGTTKIDGVPGTAAPVLLDFAEDASGEGISLFPTKSRSDVCLGVEVTAIDHGMPVVLLLAEDLGKTGAESPAELEADRDLTHRVDAIRMEMGRRMGLGDVSRKTVPKMCLVSPPRHGGTISTRTFIPHRVHQAIGVFGALSVATACALPGTIARKVCTRVPGVVHNVEHPTGSFPIALDVSEDASRININQAAFTRTVRPIMEGNVFVPQTNCEGAK